ncbi:MAG: ATP-binding cassette domain-containing protein [Oscillospiraceae bacterium]
MITISNLGMQFGGSVLFKQVDLQFTPGNCYGVIGANGAGKSTFLKMLSGELEPTSGDIFLKPGARMSVLKQDQFQYDEYPILDTVIMGNQHLYDIMKEKDALYEKEDFSEEDGLRASELETEFAELDGWEAESDASKLLQGLGIPVELHYDLMGNTDPRLKVKVLLAQALFGKPDIIMLDEPTNNLDIEAINWLENFILDYEDTGLVIVVSHDRHFLNTVCTHIVDIDYGKIKMYVGNYDFWYESSQLVQQLIRNKNKRNEEKIAELQTFISRFAANKAKSKQATSRRRLLDKLSVEEMPASSRRYPFVGFEREREVGKDILFVTDVSKTVDGVKLLDHVSFIVGKNDKIAFVGENELAQTTMFKILMGELEPDEGSVKWGQTVTTSYLPKDNSEYFDGHTESLVDWIRQYSAKKDDVYLRGFLGRMLFSGDDVFKPVNVLSGGEKVRCMLSRMMLSGANVVLLDQPTNHLDMESIQAVNKGLMAFPGNVLLASHDHEMLQTTCNRVIEFQPDGTILDRPGTYDEYLDWKRARLAPPIGTLV